jgi:nucleoside-diphosphate-sugar epimerase
MVIKATTSFSLIRLPCSILMLDIKAVEQDVLKGRVLNGIVVKPTMLYGRSGSIFGMMFDRVRTTGKVTWPGKSGGKMVTIHQDDLADLYVRAAEKAQVIGGLVFIGANSYSEDTDGFLRRMCEVADVKDEFEYFEPTNCESFIITALIVLIEHF